MPGFHDVSLPNDFAKGAKGGPNFHTTVLTLSGGKEKRNVDWAIARATYSVGYGIRDIALVQQLIDFFYARFGKAYTFRMRHWADYQIPFPGRSAQVLGTGDGVAAAFQIVKAYGDAAGTYVRTITKPVNSGTIRVLVDGVQKTEGTDFDVGYTTGIITFRSGHLPPSGKVVSLAYCEFDNQVRFDVDAMAVSQDQVLSGAWDGVDLIEDQT